MLAILLLSAMPAIDEPAGWPRVASDDGAEIRYLAPIISDADYPIEAKRADAQGVVGIEVTVLPRGQITDCQIVQSSGWADLDEQSCRIYRDRARFDIRGRDEPSKFRLRVTWLMN